MESTPFLQKPLRSRLGLTGILTGAAQILAGTFKCPDSVDNITQTVIQLLQKPAMINEPFLTQILQADYIRYWS